MPKFSKSTQEVKVPTKEKVNMILSACGKITSLKAKIIMETGLRPIELFGLLTKDIDLEQKIIYPNTAKHGNPRKIKISLELADLIHQYIQKYNRQFNEPLFRGTPIFLGRDFRTIRNLLAKKLNDPSIKNVRLYDLRHYFATMDYHKFQDIKRTQYLMGHKHSSTTDIYTHLLDYGEESEFICKTANNIREATVLIEQGFQYVTEMEGIKIFKKRK